MNIEKAKEIHSSSLWETVCQEIDTVKIPTLLEKLKVCTPDNLVVLQREIKIWEEVKRLPQDAIDRQE